LSEHQDRIFASAIGEIATTRYATTIRTRHHTLTADEPVAAGGADAGPSPFDLVLAGLCACTAITLRMYADRKEWRLTSLRVTAAFHRDGDTTHITRELHVEGDLDDAQRARLNDIAERTPVTLALKRGNDIRTTLK